MTRQYSILIYNGPVYENSIGPFRNRDNAERALVELCRKLRHGWTVNIVEDDVDDEEEES